MSKVKYIFETKDVVNFLNKRLLLKQYKKAKQFLISWDYKTTRFKERNPKWSWIYYFRINKQYRAIWKFKSDWILVIWEIDDHS